MKHKQIYRILLPITVFLAFAVAIKAKAMNTGFTTEELSEEQKSLLIEATNLSLLQTEPQKRSIRCFDVNEEGMIAIGQDSSPEENAEILVYNSHGEFLYGYVFYRGGSDFVVEWDHKNINILTFRSRDIISVDSKGNILEIREVPSTVDNSIYTNTLDSDVKTVNHTRYRIRNKMGPLNLIAFSYSQLVITDASGTERIIYDVNTEQLIRTITYLSLFQVALAVGIVFFVKTCIKLNRDK